MVTKKMSRQQFNEYVVREAKKIIAEIEATATPTSKLINILTAYYNGERPIQAIGGPKTKIYLGEFDTLKRVWNNGHGAISFAQKEEDGTLLINKLFCSKGEIADIEKNLKVPYELVELGYPDYYFKGLPQMRKNIGENASSHMLDTAQKLNKIYTVQIDYSLPTISVEPKIPGENSKSVFAQGEDAQQLLDQVPNDWDPKLYLLFYLDSAGAI